MASQKTAVLCGSPVEFCSGKLELLSNGMKNRGLKSHSNHGEAFNCFKKSLLARGYIQIDSRAFQPPDGGPIHVLTKKIRFGGKLRKGKEGTRFMGTVRHGGVCTSK